MKRLGADVEEGCEEEAVLTLCLEEWVKKSLEEQGGEGQVPRSGSDGGLFEHLQDRESSWAVGTTGKVL